MKPIALRYNQMTVMGTALNLDSSDTASHSGGVRAEFHALLAGCGLYDLSGRAKIQLTGSDRVRWLNGMVTNNIRDLAPNHGVYCFLLNAQGRIQADLYAYNLGDSLLLDVDATFREKVLAHFDKFIIMDDVEVADISATLTALGIAGPRAQAVLQAASIQSPGLAPLQLCTPKCECNCNCTQCTLLRKDDAGHPAYEIWLAPDQMKSASDTLLAAGATAVGIDALEKRRIALSIPRYGVDIHEKDLPQETGQMRALNFTKGCYLGQEIVERIRSRGNVHRHFTVFVVEGPLPAPGTKIHVAGQEDKEVGEITSSADLPLPAGNCSVALGYLRQEAANKSLLVGPATLKPSAVPII